MRQIISISLPKPLIDVVNQAVKSNSYINKSEFFRYLIRNWSESEVISQTLESKKQMKLGEKHILKSFKDLRNM
jgi:Arc/MetJ-type ribon-helix-helix transcriptional regulator